MLSLLFLCLCFQDYTYDAQDVELCVGQTGFQTIEVSSDGTPTQGFSMRFGVSSILGLEAVLPAVELGNPEFFMWNLAANGIQSDVGCVFSLQGPVFHTFPVGGEPAVVLVYTPTQEINLGLIFLGLGNVVTVNNQDVIPTQIGGAINVLPSTGVHFLRGDANGDGTFSISDPISVLNHTFGSLDLLCDSAGDYSDNGSLGLEDVVGLLVWLFGGGSAPPQPFPSCGVDPTPDALTCDVGCP